MNAQQAREITNKNLKGPVIEPYVTKILARIKREAGSGNSVIYHPLHEITPWPSLEVQEAIWKNLIDKGFKVTHYPDPDPGHPCSGPYTAINW